MGDKKGTTLRLCSGTRQTLALASSVLRKSNSLIAEEALHDYFNKHNLGSRYQVTLTKESVVLLQIGTNGKPDVLEVGIRNGESATQVAERYRVKLRAPVELVEKDG